MHYGSARWRGMRHSCPAHSGSASRGWSLTETLDGNTLLNSFQRRRESGPSSVKVEPALAVSLFNQMFPVLSHVAPCSKIHHCLCDPTHSGSQVAAFEQQLSNDEQRAMASTPGHLRGTAPVESIGACNMSVDCCRAASRCGSRILRAWAACSFDRLKVHRNGCEISRHR